MPNKVEGGPSSAQRRNLEEERRRNAQIIINVGLQLGASQRDILIALMTAMQESGLRNLNYGDRDSLGLFQQRPSMGWGTRSQIMNPEYAARAFFTGAGTNKGLLDLKNRNSMSLTAAAQAVQRSAFPNAYAKHESYGRSLLQILGGQPAAGPALQAERRPAQQAEALPQSSRTQREPGIAEVPTPSVAQGWQKRQQGPGGAAASPVAPTATGQDALQTSAVVEVFPEWEPPPGVADIASAATSEVVKPADQPINVSQWTLNELDEVTYNEVVKQAGGVVTPKGKAGDIIGYAKQFLGVPYKWGGTNPLGFDCSGLIQYVYRQFGVNLPRISFEQAAAGPSVLAKEAKAGDLWWIDNSPRNNGADHIAIYLGNGQVLEAARAGTNVRIRSLSESEMRNGRFTRVL